MMDFKTATVISWDGFHVDSFGNPWPNSGYRVCDARSFFIALKFAHRMKHLNWKFYKNVSVEFAENCGIQSNFVRLDK